MNIWLARKEDVEQLEFKPPRLHIQIGHNCCEPCEHNLKGDCKLCNPHWGRLIETIVNWLWKCRIVAISKEYGRFSGTKYCPSKLDVIRTCYNCAHQDGVDDNCDGICGNEDYYNMTTEQLQEDMDNGLHHLCRYWKPSPHDKRLHDQCNK